MDDSWSGERLGRLEVCRQQQHQHRTERMMIVMAALMAMPAMAVGERRLLNSPEEESVEVVELEDVVGVAVAMVGSFSGGLFTGFVSSFARAPPLFFSVDLPLLAPITACEGRASSGYEIYDDLEQRPSARRTSKDPIKRPQNLGIHTTTNAGSRK